MENNEIIKVSHKAYLNENEYISVLERLQTVPVREDRTGTGTHSEFGKVLSFDISDNHIPLLATKYVSFHNIIHELIWMISGSNSIKYLRDHNVGIWNQWLAEGTEVYDETGRLVDGISSSIYGESWRRWEGANGKVIDQLAKVIQQLKEDPYSRRIILEAWNVARVDEVILPPCHKMIQFYVDNDNNLQGQLYLRSNDMFLGSPYNVVFYSTLLHLLAQMTGRKATTLTYMIGDAHIYSNHLEQCALQCERFNRQVGIEWATEEAIKSGKVNPLEPKLTINLPEDCHIDDITADMFVVTDYQHLPAIKAPVAV